jgi:N-acetylglucosamine-6-phosphate deacetylase
MTQTITARALLNGDDLVDYPLIAVEDGHISAIVSREHGDPSDTFPDGTLVPAYLNIHVHGAVGHDVMEGTPAALNKIGAALASHGVGAYYPTTVTSTTEATLRGLEGIAAVIEGASSPEAAVPLGIHLEGPFLSAAKRGAHTESLLAVPSIPLFDRFWQAARGHIRILTIAPELESAAELIAHANQLGVVCSLGHSNATEVQAAAGFRAGGRSATHTFNAMRSLDHREPGIAAYVLNQDALYAEIICDGIHVAPAMVRLFYKVKGSEKTVLITDGMAATGMPDGPYKLGGMDVEVSHGRCTIAGAPNTLAGSVLTMDKAIENFAAFTGAGLKATAHCASRNPARLMGVDTRWGMLDLGREANLVALSPEGRLLQSYRNGNPLLS